MHERFEARIRESILEYAHENGLEDIWEKPVVRFADASDPGFESLKHIVTAGHCLPEDHLAGAKSVISWFLPFKKALADGNLPGLNASPEWAKAYLDTNRMAAYVNEGLAACIRSLGYDAAPPKDAGMISKDEPKSRWSQRHVAYLAGHGTFGLNNMLISDAGSTGRYFSLITTMPLEPDPIIEDERCLYKKDGSCGLCVRRCPADALTEQGFDRYKCLERCLANDALYPGADVCGKCAVSLPCSHKIPNI